MAGTTDRYALELLASGQAQKEVSHNEALVRIDALLHAAVESRTLATPPAAPAAGQCWLVADGASGDWAGQAGKLAFFCAGGWRFATAQDGCLVWVRAEGVFARRTPWGWNVGDWPAHAVVIGGDKVLGGRQPGIATPAGGSVIDVEARSAIGSVLAALRTHGLIAS
jgi:hypothetical protein